MHRKNASHVVDLLFTLALFCLFAATALAVVLLGANVYRRTVNEMDRNTGVRTSLTFLAEKVRQNDRADGVRVAELNGSDALVFSQTVGGGDVYETWLFLADGNLREVLVKAGTPIQPESGQVVSDLSDWDLSIPADGLLQLTVMDEEGHTDQLTVALRCAFPSY